MSSCRVLSVCVLLYSVCVLFVFAEYIELVDGTMLVLLDMLNTWAVATDAAVGVKARVSLPPPPERVQFISPAWKLPVELPTLPAVGAPVADKARFIQEAVTVLMIFLDEINPEGDDYIRHARKMVLLRLEAVSTGAEAWLRECDHAIAKKQTGWASSPRYADNKERGTSERKSVDDGSGEDDSEAAARSRRRERRRERA
jgi:hypothetical protein